MYGYYIIILMIVYLVLNVGNDLPEPLSADVDVSLFSEERAKVCVGGVLMG